MNILITGGEGFIGKNLINYFKNTKHQIISPKLQNLDLCDAKSVEDLFKHSKNFNSSKGVYYYKKDMAS